MLGRTSIGQPAAACCADMSDAGEVGVSREVGLVGGAGDHPLQKGVHVLEVDGEAGGHAPWEVVEGGVRG